MPQFFIERPVFAWVIAIFIVLAGVIAIPQLPVERYPTVAPPSVSIFAVYPGATPQTMNDATMHTNPAIQNGARESIGSLRVTTIEAASPATITSSPSGMNSHTFSLFPESFTNASSAR